MKIIWLCLAWMLGMTAEAASHAPHAFGVLNYRSLQATAADWNPVLNDVTARSGVPLELHIGRTANETTDRVMADFAERRGLKYRVLSESEPYFDLAIMASTRVRAADGENVRLVFVNLVHDPEEQRVLQAAAQSVGMSQGRGFVRVDDRDYNNYREFLKRTLVPLNE